MELDEGKWENVDWIHDWKQMKRYAGGIMPPTYLHVLHVLGYGAG